MVAAAESVGVSGQGTSGQFAVIADRKPGGAQVERRFFPRPKAARETRSVPAGAKYLIGV